MFLFSTKNVFFKKNLYIFCLIKNNFIYFTWSFQFLLKIYILNFFILKACKNGTVNFLDHVVNSEWGNLVRWFRAQG